MAISFAKNHSHILAAWKDVLDGKSNTNWSLFGYEGQTNELKVVEVGNGGLEELCDELNSGKIMYAFVRIEDPKSGLSKFLLINWQGEGAPVLRKGTCANHIHEVSKLLSGAHLTIAARNEDDIDLDRLLKKLSAVSSAYNFARGNVQEPKAPVGTNYSRIIPTKELNTNEMQQFWRKEEAEEKQRVEAERTAKIQELQKLEDEQRTREEKEHRERETRIKSESKLQPAHVPIKTSPQPLSPEKTVPTLVSGMSEAERMRQARNLEARELIGSRVGAAKAIFTKNTSESQLQSKLNTAPPTKPARNSISQRINVFNQSNQLEQDILKKDTTNCPELYEDEKKIECKKSIVDVSSEHVESELIAPVTPELTAIANNDDDILPIEDFPLEPDCEQFSTIKRSPHSKTNSLQSPDDTSSSNTTDTTEEVRTKVSTKVQQPQSAKNTFNAMEKHELPDLVNEDDFICQESLGDLGLRALALYDYQAADESEITFDPGDIITHIDQIDAGWWQGLGPDGTYGLFPANYVEIIN